MAKKRAAKPKAKSPNKTKAKAKSPNKTKAKAKSPNKTKAKEKSPNKTKAKEKSPNKTKAKAKSPNKTKAKEKSPNKTKAKEKSPNKTKAKAKSPEKTEAFKRLKPKNAAKPKTTIVFKPKIDPKILPNPKRTSVVPSIGKPLKPDKKLAAVIGKGALLREKVNELIWNYINERGLRDPQNKRMINADEKLKVVFDGKKQVTQFELNDLINKRLKK